jgi:hypothetical protein
VLYSEWRAIPLTPRNKTSAAPPAQVSQYPAHTGSTTLTAKPQSSWCIQIYLPACSPIILPEAAGE